MDVVPPALLTWLTTLVRERISRELDLSFDHDAGWMLTAPGSSRVIEIAPHRALPQGLCTLIGPCGTPWTPEREGWNAPLDTPLLTPGGRSNQGSLINKSPDGYRLGYDVLWFAAWMLSRAEECVRTERDEHGRFPASASHAQENGYLERPLIDEWFDIVRQIATRTWPGLALTDPKFRVELGHDIDEPYLAEGLGFTAMVRRSAGDIMRRGRAMRGISAPIRWLVSRTGLKWTDPFDTFAWIMTQAERHGLRSHFFFLAGNTDSRFDRSYHLSESYLQARLRSIRDRGHIVGLHPSYASGADSKCLCLERGNLERSLCLAGVPTQVTTSRMHYLRWQTPDTPRALAAAGIKQDFSLGYAERIGFRSGTSFCYDAFDPKRNEVIDLRIHPLIAMDATFFQDGYMGLTSENSTRLVSQVKARCRRLGGTFTLCWHNSRLESQAQRSLFLMALDA